MVTNQAHITGDNEKTIEQDVEKDVPVTNHNGSANGSKGSVTLEKVLPAKQNLRELIFNFGLSVQMAKKIN
ncbi:hypothetical protein [Lactococcus sp. FSL W8-0209]|uniref:hypothetical protein n=1 Tax=Lactococcus sp. FSL W8-0209 TaxID=2921712 RepID=UPI0030F61B93